MNHLLRGLVGLIIGAFCGAVVGAIILALPLSPENNCDPVFGCQADWKLLGVYIGSMFGGVAGGVIGLIVGIASSSRLKSMGIGALTALILAIEFFGVGGFIDEQVGPIAILSIPGGAMVGLIVKEFLTLVRLARQARYT
jgi:hypothetical protein